MSPGGPRPPMSSPYMNYEAGKDDMREQRDDMRDDIQEQQNRDDVRRRSRPLPQTERDGRRFLSPGRGGEGRGPSRSYSLEEESDVRMNRDSPPPRPETTRSRFMSPPSSGGDGKGRRSFPLYDGDRENMTSSGAGGNANRLRLRSSFPRYDSDREEGHRANRPSTGGGSKISRRTYPRYTEDQDVDDDDDDDVGLNRPSYPIRIRGRSRGPGGRGGDHGAYDDEYVDGKASRTRVAKTPPLARAERLLERRGVRGAGRSRYY